MQVLRHQGCAPELRPVEGSQVRLRLRAVCNCGLHARQRPATGEDLREIRKSSAIRRPIKFTEIELGDLLVKPPRLGAGGTSGEAGRSCRGY